MFFLLVLKIEVKRELVDERSLILYVFLGASGMATFQISTQWNPME